MKTFHFTELGFQQFLELVKIFRITKCQDWQNQTDLLGFKELPGFTPILAQIAVDDDFKTITIVIFDMLIDAPGFGICNCLYLEYFRENEVINSITVGEHDRNYFINYFENLNVECNNQNVN